MAGSSAVARVLVRRSGPRGFVPRSDLPRATRRAARRACCGQLMPSGGVALWALEPRRPILSYAGLIQSSAMNRHFDYGPGNAVGWPVPRPVAVCTALRSAPPVLCSVIPLSARARALPEGATGGRSRISPRVARVLGGRGRRFPARSATVQRCAQSHSSAPSGVFYPSAGVYAGRVRAARCTVRAARVLGRRARRFPARSATVQRSAQSQSAAASGVFYSSAGAYAARVRAARCTVRAARVLGGRGRRFPARSATVQRCAQSHSSAPSGVFYPSAGAYAGRVRAARCTVRVARVLGRRARRFPARSATVQRCAQSQFPVPSVVFLMLACPARCMARPPRPLASSVRRL